MSLRLLISAVALVGLVATVSSWRTCCAAAPEALRQVGGVTLSGSVVDAQLRPIAGAVIELTQGAGATLRATSGTDGMYRIAGLTRGTYRVRVSKSGYPATERSLSVAADATSLTLPLVLMRPGDEIVAAEDRGIVQRNAQAVGGAMAPPPAPTGLAVPGIAMPSTSAVRPEPQRAAGRGQNQVMLDGMSGEFRQPSMSGRGEGYAHVEANQFRRTVDEPLSTFGADVDTASYTNVRRFLRTGQLPPADAVRVEEFINYFKFDYPEPRGEHPISVTAEIGDAPWDPRHKLVLVGARAVAAGRRDESGRSIVLLVDVSGSMASPDKLPLVQSGLGLFVDALQPTDTVAIVTYAGASGVALPPTPARDRERILSAIAGLGAGGSTNGAQGIVTAYRLARQAFIPGGVNRVVLATDGDFNVGVTSHEGLLQLIERERQSGVFLSVLGVGTGNLQDATMELLADKGNGNYAYLDSLQEARRVLVREAGSTLETVAKDVKFQVEFNPAQVAAWKLVGYENRLMAHRDFNDDRKDGGELGAGHTVTVLYEIVPAGAGDGDEATRPQVDPLRYQPVPEPRAVGRPAAPSPEWFTVKVRYQQPDGRTSRLIERPVAPAAGVRAEHLPFAAAVAEFGQLLREPRVEGGRWNALVSRLERMTMPAGRAADRTEVLELVTLAAALARLQ